MTGGLFDRFLAADLVVLASPLYHYNLNARMKTFIERTLPMIKPDFVDRGAKTGHPLRVAKAPRIAAVSVCAFPETENFKALSLNLRMIFGPGLVAEIYRHSSEFMAIPELAPRVAEVLAALSTGRGRAGAPGPGGAGHPGGVGPGPGPPGRPDPGGEPGVRPDSHAPGQPSGAAVTRR